MITSIINMFYLIPNKYYQDIVNIISDTDKHLRFSYSNQGLYVSVPSLSTLPPALAAAAVVVE